MATERYDLILRGGTLADGTRADVAVAGSQIARIAPRIEGEAASTEDLDGRVILPSFVDLHMHLDKAFTQELNENLSGTLLEAIRRYSEIAPRLTRESFVERALRTLRLCVAAGTTAVRTHVNIPQPGEGPAGSLMALEGLFEARERVRDYIDMQIVLLPEGNLVRDGALRWRCEEALRDGADLVGGAPALDPDPVGAIEGAFDLAMRFDRDLDLHVDETDDPNVRYLPMIATLASERGYAGRVTAGHCCSLAAIDEEESARIIERVAEARMTVVTLPSCNLYLQGRGDRQPIRRGLTRVKELMAAGVNVAAASDNIRDPFNPFGRGDLLHIADLMAHAVQLGSPSQQAAVRDAIGANPRACFRGTDPETLRGGQLHAGDPADLAVCDTRSVHDLIATQATRSLVVSRGRVVARARATCETAF